jgi:hypothetical protein
VKKEITDVDIIENNTRSEFWFKYCKFIDFSDIVELLDSGVKIISIDSKRLEMYRSYVAYYLKKKGLPSEIVDNIMKYMSYNPVNQIDRIK